MKIDNTQLHFSKSPKNYSRKNNICSCLCPVVSLPILTDVLDNVKVKYKLTINELCAKPEKKNYRRSWSTFQYWAFFDKIIELPKIFDELNENDFIIKTAYFTRDDVQIPFVSEIEIINLKKYKNIKIKDNRKRKLLNLIYN